MLLGNEVRNQPVSNGQKPSNNVSIPLCASLVNFDSVSLAHETEVGLFY